MEGTKIDVLERQLFVIVSTIESIVKAVIAGSVKAALTTPCNEMVFVKRFDVCAHLIDPFRDYLGSTVLTTG
jgi:hypothetical protein